VPRPVQLHQEPKSGEKDSTAYACCSPITITKGWLESPAFRHSRAMGSAKDHHKRLQAHQSTTASWPIKQASRTVAGGTFVEGANGLRCSTKAYKHCYELPPPHVE
jgi:hypothetical protein